jgi:hypothetical protein
MNAQVPHNQRLAYAWSARSARVRSAMSIIVIGVMFGVHLWILTLFLLRTTIG